MKVDKVDMHAEMAKLKEKMDKSLERELIPFLKALQGIGWKLSKEEEELIAGGEASKEEK